MKTIKLIECPRDAMQGIKSYIPTKEKVDYLQSLLRCGFDTIDFGSFVSPKSIPQMADTQDVLKQLDLSETNSKLLAIVANLRGAEQASMFPEIKYLGYPFSISENFQMRNTHKTITQSVAVLKAIIDLARQTNKQVVVYLSMGFGNPYDDPWSVAIVGRWVEKLTNMGIRILSLSDTVGSATPKTISYIFSNLIPQYPAIEFGAHLHTLATQWHKKMDAAYNAGCLRFDGAIQGFGGCPMAKDELIGNMPTERMLSYFTTKNIPTGIAPMSFESAYNQASKIFQNYH